MMSALDFPTPPPQHPWIATSVQAIQSHDGARGSTIIEEMVCRHLPMLQSYREVRTVALQYTIPAFNLHYVGSHP